MVCVESVCGWLERMKRPEPHTDLVSKGSVHDTKSTHIYTRKFSGQSARVGTSTVMSPSETPDTAAGVVAAGWVGCGVGLVVGVGAGLLIS